MTAWGACSLVQIVSTIQSSRTAETVAVQEQAVSAEILAAYFQRSWSLRTIRSLGVDFGLQSLHPKIPFPPDEFSSGK